MTGVVAQEITKKLEQALVPSVLELTDDSHKHVGHAGHDGRGESHFRLLVVSEKFEGVRTVERHRMIYDILQGEMKDRVHALQIKAFTEKEYSGTD